LFGLNPLALTQSALSRINATTGEEQKNFLNLLYFLFASGVAEKEKLNLEAKTTLLKFGETNIATLDRKKLLLEIEAELDKFGKEEFNAKSNRKSECFRLIGLLMQIPFESSAMELILDAATVFSKNPNIPADCAYSALFYIYEQTKNPASRRYFLSADPDFWENYLAIILKTMGRFLKDAVMQYIEYYELPPGSSNEIHLERCKKLCEIAVECCYLVHKASGLVETQIDKKIYQFCSDAILKKDAKPLVTYSYRLIDLSSEDFFITLPKDIINKYIVDAIELQTA
jgi:hypothetical protein